MYKMIWSLNAVKNTRGKLLRCRQNPEIHSILKVVKKKKIIIELADLAKKKKNN